MGVDILGVDVLKVGVMALICFTDCYNLVSHEALIGYTQQNLFLLDKTISCIGYVGQNLFLA